MKIIILSLASELQPFKYIREEGQMKTWDSVDVDGVETVYYYSGDEFSVNGKNLTLPCSGDYDKMHWRLKMALDYLLTKEWDYIFRISASSYVDKLLLKAKCEGLPREKSYVGIPICDGTIASGCGFIISRDVAELLRNEIQQVLPVVQPDDVLVGQILLPYKYFVPVVNPIVYNYYDMKDRIPIPNMYHYRCKGPINDGIQDVVAMKHIFELKKNDNLPYTCF